VDLQHIIQQLRHELERIKSAIAALESVAPLEVVTVPLRPPPRKRGRKGMNAEERKVVSERMRRYWAERRQQESTSQEDAPAYSAPLSSSTQSVPAR
jgi:hypothetical protein